MANMDYCRFTNTLADLLECAEHIEDSDLSEVETKARAKLIRMCHIISSENMEDK